MNIQEMITRYRSLNEAMAQKTDAVQTVTRCSMELLEKAHGAKAQMLAQNHMLKTISAALKSQDVDVSRPSQSQNDCQSQEQSIAMQRLEAFSAKDPSAGQPRQQPGIQPAKGHGVHSLDQFRQQLLQRPSIQVPKAQGVHRPALPCQQPNVRQLPGAHSAKGQRPPQPHQQTRQMPLPTPDADVEHTVDLQRVIFEVVSLGGPEALARVLREVLDSNTSASDDTVWEDCD